TTSTGAGISYSNRSCTMLFLVDQIGGHAPAREFGCEILEGEQAHARLRARRQAVSAGESAREQDGGHARDLRPMVVGSKDVPGELQGRALRIAATQADHHAA